MSQERTVRAAVIGAGHMGRHHVRIYADMPNVDLVAVVDADRKRANEYAEKYHCQAFDTPDAIVDKVDVVSIAVPTQAHLSVAKIFLEAGIPVLIEKPLAGSIADAQAICDLAKKHDTIVQVGHTERFNPVVRAVHRMDVKAQFIETHRISPFTFRSADVGVVMDMMIHDIDIVLSLTHQPIEKLDAVGVNVLGPNEDIANARVTFENGCVANLTASRLALKTERKIRIFSPEAYLSLDYQKRSGIAVKKDANLDMLKLAREKNITDLAELAGYDYSKMVNVEPLMITDEDPLEAELASFVEAAVDGTEPAVSGEEGLQAVEAAERIVTAIKNTNWHLS